MQSLGLVILTVLGMTLIAGLSVGPYALYIVLPASVLERASHHGRHLRLGTRARLRAASGVARVVVDGRLPQSAREK
jgi:hypothetical protein